MSKWQLVSKKSILIAEDHLRGRLLIVILAAGVSQSNWCPAGELGSMTTTANVGFMVFWILSPYGRLAEGAVWFVVVSQALFWCMHLAHRHSTWCKGGISMPSSVALGVNPPCKLRHLSLDSLPE